jgi:protein involved in polysaccharide export with SLBB domain
VRQHQHLWSCLCLLIGLSAAPAHAVEAPDTAAVDWSQIPEYRIVPGDRLVLNFGPNPASGIDLHRDAKVRPDGRISVFPVGDVIAAGRTVRELESALLELLGAELKQPRVTIEIQELGSNQVHVLGQVRNPGSYAAGTFMTLSQAIATAGGFNDDASRNSILVFHRDGARTVRVTRVRLDRAMKRGMLESDVALARFDIVYVPRSTIGNINLFTHQLFSETGNALSTSLIGWELFNLDRVFVGGKLKTQ